jgi:hypothetical protein
LPFQKRFFLKKHRDLFEKPPRFLKIFVLFLVDVPPRCASIVTKTTPFVVNRAPFFLQILIYRGDAPRGLLKKAPLGTPKTFLTKG